MVVEMGVKHFSNVAQLKEMNYQSFLQDKEDVD